MEVRASLSSYRHLMPGKVLGGILAPIHGGSEVVGVVLGREVDAAGAGNRVEGYPLRLDLLGGGYAVDVHHVGVWRVTCVNGRRSGRQAGGQRRRVGRQWTGENNALNPAHAHLSTYIV